MTYDWLSRKTQMEDPDMGHWYYEYDNNGNLVHQRDAKTAAPDWTITLVYDAMNRLTNKNYLTGSSTANVTYSYDAAVTGYSNIGRRTGMTDTTGTNSSSYKYDARGRLAQEQRTIDSVAYTTSYAYLSNDSIYQITYPTGEIVTNAFNTRGLPTTVSGSAAGSIVTGTTYNQFGSITQISLNNNLKTNYSYWGIDHSTTDYGKLCSTPGTITVI
jgi:YD repeat-containing protein